MNSPNAPYPFKLPDVGEGIHEAEIVRWLAQPGDAVALNQPLLEIQTDKAVVEIPAPVAGTVVQIHVPEGTLARVGDLLVT
ncbi:MAG: dienelactone hydrolase, partial [Chloroflexi bacterium]